jgi:hypothetical protein
MAERGAVTRALLVGVGAGSDDRGLAERLRRACIEGLDVDGAAISVLTASEARATLWSSDRIAERIEDLQFSLNEGACTQAAITGSHPRHPRPDPRPRAPQHPDQPQQPRQRTTPH